MCVRRGGAQYWQARTEEGWMALRGPGGKLLGVICPKHVPVFRAQIEEEGGKLPIRLEGHEN